jgi:hypothetical protein
MHTRTCTRQQRIFNGQTSVGTYFICIAHRHTHTCKHMDIVQKAQLRIYRHTFAGIDEGITNCNSHVHTHRHTLTHNHAYLQICGLCMFASILTCNSYTQASIICAFIHTCTHTHYIHASTHTNTHISSHACI